MRWSRRRQGSAVQRPEGPAKLPTDIRLSLQRGESVLAAAQDDTSPEWLVLTTFRVLVVVEAGTVGMERGWHEVATGAWDPESATLSLSWVGGVRAMQWVLGTRTGPGRVPQVLRERVSASVVQAREVSVGPRRTARVSVRSVLRTRELIDQVVWGPGSSPTDAELVAEVEKVRAEVRTAVGLPPQRTADDGRGDS
ncbi:MAG TPA: hypothetical protein VJ976_04335 [Ornithinimicrobium sp.]|uniref:hypothetical protein n=1 Tax=Ornithinimicrobium sp. TaxID=1977084 RepID=UPI002B45D8F3|nr:hypothetical protein [Ornithinimicrobium sp.]HKJ11603.1 hypothetical protein [Ornithinimicrobium sp.]